LDINGNLFIRGTISQNVNFNDPNIVIGPVIDPGPIVINPSDVRLKRNIAGLDGALGRLLQLRGVTFDWNELAQQESSDEPQIGFLAQDVETVFPQWVRSNGDGYKHLAIRGFEALAVEALRELQAEIEQLREKIRALEGQLTVG
jgi:hypothetical protein